MRIKKCKRQCSYPEIPTGDYCYAEGGLCPHFVTKVVNGVDLPWCTLLNMGSVPASSGSLTATDRANLTEAWGEVRLTEQEISGGVAEGIYANEEEARALRYFRTPKEFDLFLLWDQCKECGVNSEHPGIDWYSRSNPGRFNPQYPNHIVVFLVTATIPGSCKEVRTFPVWVKVGKSGSPTQKVRQVVRFLTALPGTLAKNCGIKQGSLAYPGLADRQLTDKGNLVAYAYSVVQKVSS